MLQKTKYSTGRYRMVENTVVLLFLITVVIAEIYRLIHWNFTWDESLTFNIFIKPIFFDQNPTFVEVLAFFKEQTGCWCAMNNHVLNTLSMAAFAKCLFRFFGYGNEIVLRLPVIVGFFLYIGGTIFMYRKRRISWLGVFLLCGSRYMMDFFALARGYSIAASFVLLACICMIEWENDSEKEWLVLLSVVFVTVGIIAQTVTLTIAAPIYLWIFIRLFQNKVFLHFVKPKRLIIILLLILINGAMLLFHFAVSRADHCMAPSDDTSLRSVMMNMFIGGETDTYFYIFTIVFYVFLIAGWVLFFRKKTPWPKMCFVFIFTIYIVIMSAMINTIRLGLPVSRMLLPAFPVMALAIYGCICELAENMPVKAKYIPAILCVLVVLGIWCKQYDLTASREWPGCQGIKAQCYDAYEKGTKVELSEDNAKRSESWTFYRYQIQAISGYDIVE